MCRQTQIFTEKKKIFNLMTGLDTSFCFLSKEKESLEMRLI
jgi:hypothetical protein